jgi:PIN domain nuclease of toxin-antitoxin system
MGSLPIKASIGKLPLHEPFETLIPSELRRNRIGVVGITIEHLNRVIALPLHHRDPFDRMLVAQAMVEGVPILGADENFDAYGVQRLW